VRLPAAEMAIIDSAKIRDYLLSTEHPVGRGKATFFNSLGYSRANWGRLLLDIRRIAEAYEATFGQPSAFGQKYEVRGTLVGPSGRRARIVTAWIVLAGENAPRFITAFPG
jgi:hypothetical protein